LGYIPELALFWFETRLFRKRFLFWYRDEDYKLLRENRPEGDALLFRNTWTDGSMAKKRKQEKLRILLVLYSRRLDHREPDSKSGMYLGRSASY
jgi:hypothetical protein